MIEQIISGGQTGVDQLGLKVGRFLGLRTGGVAPKHWRTELGPRPELAEYGLIQSWSYDYQPRTWDNVRCADATIWLGNDDTPGFKCTITAIKAHRKPYIVNPDSAKFLAWLHKHRNIKVLNVAGNRGSKLTLQDRQKFAKLLIETIQTFNNTTLTT